ncbi:MAG TPA: glycosyltransferase family 9 protein [Candidatus Omnitrophota bacterium]|nr:glycosyltransferase family 9 protein [Candidatus Omnitrophota bacterium]
MWIKELALKIYFLLRLPLIYLMLLCFGKRDVKKYIEVSKIMLLRLDRLGDLVLTIPVLDNIKLYYPDARIAVMVRPSLEGVAKLIGSIDAISVYRDFFSAVKMLKEAHFDLVIDMLADYRFRPAALAFLSGAPKRIGFSGGYKELLFTDVVAKGRIGRSMVDINLDIVRQLGIPVKIETPRIVLREPQKISEKNLVAIHPGGFYPSQRWGADRFAYIAGMVRDRYDVDVVIIGGPGEEILVEEILKKARLDRTEAIFPEAGELASVISRSRLLICNNSGPLHLAAALGIPTVSIMGPTDPDLWWPQGENQIVIRKDLKCSPCNRGYCKIHTCMESVTVEEVFEKVKGALDHLDGIKRNK